MASLRLYVVWLVVPGHGCDSTLVLRFVVEESMERAAEVCAHRFSGQRVLRMRELAADTASAA